MKIEQLGIFSTSLGLIFTIYILSGCNPSQSTHTLPTDGNASSSYPTLQEFISSTPTPPGRKCPGFFVTYDEIINETYSPNQQWITRNKVELVKDMERSIFSLWIGQDMIWEVENTPFVCPSPPSPFPFAKPFYWTKDGHYMFFTHEMGGDGCYGATPLTITDLVRLDLFTGSTEVITEHGGIWSVFSPDEDDIAFVSYGRYPGARVLNIATGYTQEIDLPLDITNFSVWNTSNIVWSPDSTRFVYVLISDYCDYPRGETWLILVNPFEETSQTIFQSLESFTPISWDDSGNILIYQDKKLFLFNPENKSIQNLN